MAQQGIEIVGQCQQLAWIALLQRILRARLDRRELSGDTAQRT